MSPNCRVNCRDFIVRTENLLLEHGFVFCREKSLNLEVGSKPKFFYHHTPKKIREVYLFNTHLSERQVVVDNVVY